MNKSIKIIIFIISLIIFAYLEYILIPFWAKARPLLGPISTLIVIVPVVIPIVTYVICFNTPKSQKEKSK